MYRFPANDYPQPDGKQPIFFRYPIQNNRTDWLPVYTPTVLVVPYSFIPNDEKPWDGTQLDNSAVGYISTGTISANGINITWKSGSTFSPNWKTIRIQGINYNISTVIDQTHIRLVNPVTLTFEGQVETNGTTIKWLCGDKFDTIWTGNITINNINYIINKIIDDTTLTITESAGTQTQVIYKYETNITNNILYTYRSNIAAAYYVEATSVAPVAGHDNVGVFNPDYNIYRVNITHTELNSYRIDLNPDVGLVTFYDINYNETNIDNATWIKYTLNHNSVEGYVKYYPGTYYYDLSNVAIPSEELPHNHYKFIWETSFAKRNFRPDGAFDRILECDANNNQGCGLIHIEYQLNHPGEILADMCAKTPAIYFDNLKKSQDRTIGLYRPIANALQDIFDESTLFHGINWVNRVPVNYTPYLAYLIGVDLPNFTNMSDEYNDSIRKSMLKRGAELQRLKGSRRAIVEMFKIFGFTVDLIQCWSSVDGKRFIAPNESLPLEYSNNPDYGTQEITTTTICQTDPLALNFSETGYGQIETPLLYKAKNSTIIFDAFIIDNNISEWKPNTNYIKNQRVTIPPQQFAGNINIDPNGIDITLIDGHTFNNLQENKPIYINGQKTIIQTIHNHQSLTIQYPTEILSDNQYIYNTTNASYISTNDGTYSGTINVNNVTVTQVSGDLFNSNWVDRMIKINGVNYRIQSIINNNQLMIADSIGIINGATYDVNRITDSTVPHWSDINGTHIVDGDITWEVDNHSSAMMKDIHNGLIENPDLLTNSLNNDEMLCDSCELFKRINVDSQCSRDVNQYYPGVLGYSRLIFTDITLDYEEHHGDTPFKPDIKIDIWRARKNYKIGEYISVNEYTLQCIQDGTSNVSEPNWALILNNITVDNNIRWLCISDQNRGAIRPSQGSITFDRINSIVRSTFSKHYDFAGKSLYCFATYKRDKVNLPHAYQHTDLRSNRFDISIENIDDTDISIYDYIISFINHSKAFHSLLRKLHITVDMTSVYNVNDFCTKGALSIERGGHVDDCITDVTVVPNQTAECLQSAPLLSTTEPECADESSGARTKDLELRSKIMSGLQEEYDRWYELKNQYPKLTDEQREQYTSTSLVEIPDPDYNGVNYRGQDRLSIAYLIRNITSNPKQIAGSTILYLTVETSETNSVTFTTTYDNETQKFENFKYANSVFPPLPIGITIPVFVHGKIQMVDHEVYHTTIITCDNENNLPCLDLDNLRKLHKDLSSDPRIKLTNINYPIIPEYCYGGRVNDTLPGMSLIAPQEMMRCKPCLMMGVGLYYLMDCDIGKPYPWWHKDQRQLHYDGYYFFDFEKLCLGESNNTNLDVDKFDLFYPGHRFISMDNLKEDMTHDLWKRRPWDDFSTCFDSCSISNPLNAHLIMGDEEDCCGELSEKLIYEEEELTYLNNNRYPDIADLSGNPNPTGYFHFTFTHSTYTTASINHENISGIGINSKPTFIEHINAVDPIFESARRCGTDENYTDFIDGYPAAFGPLTVSALDFWSKREGEEPNIPTYCDNIESIGDYAINPDIDDDTYSALATLSSGVPTDLSLFRGHRVSCNCLAVECDGNETVHCNICCVDNDNKLDSHCELVDIIPAISVTDVFDMNDIHDCGSSTGGTTGQVDDCIEITPDPPGETWPVIHFISGIIGFNGASIVNWDETRNIIDNSAGKQFDRGGVLCQCCPTFLELRRGGRYITDFDEKGFDTIFLNLKGYNSHETQAFKFQLRYGYDTPGVGSEVLSWDVFNTYTINPKETFELKDIDVSGVIQSNEHEICFMIVIELDAEQEWLTDCDFCAEMQIEELRFSYVTDDAPIITSDLSISYSLGDMVSYNIEADSGPVSYGASNLPNDLTINTSTGLISGIINQVGVFTIPISANNMYGTGSANLILNVN